VAHLSVISEGQALEAAHHISNFGITVFYIKYAHYIACLLIVKVFQEGIRFKGLSETALLSSRTAVPRILIQALSLFKAQISKFGFSNRLPEGLLLLSHSEIKLALVYHKKSEGADSRLVAVAACIEKHSAGFQKLHYLFHVYTLLKIVFV
jgi:hypothetical protein